VYADKGDKRFERASVRFAARVALERNLSPSEARPAFLLDKPRAAAALDMSLSRFDRFVYPHLKVVRTGLEGADPH
jgi:hypothetical protein